MLVIRFKPDELKEFINSWTTTIDVKDAKETLNDNHSSSLEKLSAIATVGSMFTNMVERFSLFLGQPLAN